MAKTLIVLGAEDKLRDQQVKGKGQQDNWCCNRTHAVGGAENGGPENKGLDFEGQVSQELLSIGYTSVLLYYMSDCGRSVSTRSLFGPPFSGPAFSVDPRRIS